MRRRTAAHVRRFGRPDAVRAAALVLVVAALAGCGGAGVESGADAEDAVYVEYMAALTLAVEENLTGDAAEARIVELGAQPLSRDEIDLHVQRLSRDPVRWSRLEEQVEQRVEELRRGQRSPTSAP